MAGVFDHLHIKRNTAGSSNELSFDVLDAARDDLDGKRKKGKRTFAFPSSGGFQTDSPASPNLSQPEPRSAKTPSLQDNQGVSRYGKLAADKEVERRKRARRAHSVRLWVVGAIVVLAAIAAAAWLGYRHYVEVQDFSVRFDALVNRFAEEDAFLSQIDDLMGSLDDEAKSSKRADAAKDIPNIMEGVGRTKANASDAQPLATSNEDRAVLAKIAETCDARIGMLAAAQEAFDVSAEKEERCKEAAQIWSSVVNASQEAKEATKAFNAASTEDAVKNARKQTETAMKQLQDAQKRLKTMAASGKNIDLSKQDEYLTAKIESLEAAVATSDALIDGDRDLAKKKNEEYNAIDGKAATLAKQLPLTAEETVETAYAEDLARCAAAYQSARDEAVAADTLIREYITQQ